MRTFAKFALRFLCLVAVVGLLSMLLAPPSPSTHSPYTSALSSLAASSAHAANCPDKGCPISQNGKCAHKVGFAGCALINGTCDDRLCI